MLDQNSKTPRRGAMILIAMFSCLQILLGLFLIIGSNSNAMELAENKDSGVSTQILTLAEQKNY